MSQAKTNCCDNCKTKITGCNYGCDKLVIEHLKEQNAELKKQNEQFKAVNQFTTCSTKWTWEEARKDLLRICHLEDREEQISECEAWACHISQRDDSYGRYVDKINQLETKLANAVTPEHKIGQQVWLVRPVNKAVSKVKVVGFMVEENKELQYILENEYGDTHAITSERIFTTQDKAEAALARFKVGG